MSANKTFRLDGREIGFQDGDTVMDAALRADAYIPHLCHNPEFSPHGSCRVCIVAINGRHVSACTQPAGYVADNSDCDDTNPKINFRGTEIKGNGIDENCNGMADDAVPSPAVMACVDKDGDGYPAAS